MQDNLPHFDTQDELLDFLAAPSNHTAAHSSVTRYRVTATLLTTSARGVYPGARLTGPDITAALKSRTWDVSCDDCGRGVRDCDVLRRFVPGPGNSLG